MPKRAAPYDSGSGPAVVVIPGLQGRWEWMRPALDALSRRCRVVSYSLARAPTFQDLVRQLDDVLDDRELGRSAICGVSFGGLVAATFAAARAERTSALVLVSTPSPSWRPNPVQARYLARPWLSTPAFLASSPGRLWPEIAAAIEGTPARLRFCLGYCGRIVAAPIVPADMAARLRLNPGAGLQADCSAIVAPTLVVTGQPGLDRVVPVESTRGYLQLIDGAKYAMMDRTGHIGLMTRPERFARIVGDFVHDGSS